MKNLLYDSNKSHKSSKFTLRWVLKLSFFISRIKWKFEACLKKYLTRLKYESQNLGIMSKKLSYTLPSSGLSDSKILFLFSEFNLSILNIIIKNEELSLETLFIMTSHIIMFSLSRVHVFVSFGLVQFFNYSSAVIHVNLC